MAAVIVGCSFSFGAADAASAALSEIDPGAIEVVEVRFESRGTEIAGSLVSLKGAANCPAVVLIHGSGRSERLIGYATKLATQGMVVLTYDKRGVGASGGNYVGWRNASAANLERLADDAAAAFNVLCQDPKVDPTRVGLLAFSQGGWIAPIVAARQSAVSFLVLLSSPAVTARQEIRFSRLSENNPTFLQQHFAAEIEDIISRKTFLDRFRSDFDPQPYLRQLSIPTLWIFGDQDCSIPVDASVKVIERLGKDRFEVKRYPNCGHSLRLPNAKSAPANEITADLVAWIRRLGPHASIEQNQTEHLPPGVRLVPDLVYASPGGRDLKADLLLPPCAGERHPAIVFIHGGGWRSGSKRQLRSFAMQAAANGYVALCVEYRLSPEARYPAAVEDCWAAVGWLRARARDFSIDPERIGVMGQSAGGYLAVMMGVTGIGTERIQAVVALNPVVDLEAAGKAGSGELCAATEDFLGATYAANPALWREASPMGRVSTRAAPMLLVHGTADRTVPCSQSVAMEQELRGAGVPVEYQAIPGAGHLWFFQGRVGFEATLRRTLEFFAKHLDEQK